MNFTIRQALRCASSQNVKFIPTLCEDAAYRGTQMRRMLLSVVTLAMLTLPLAAQQESDLAAAPRISIAELRKLQAANNAIVIDVRDAESFATGHIPGARSIPLATLLDSARVAELKTTPKEIVLYCA